MSWSSLTVWLLALGVTVIMQRFRITAAVLGLGLLVGLLLSARGGAGPAARRNGCISNMKQIGLAVQSYESVHGHFPPAYTTDDQGNPLHSWRVLILPYLEEEELYDSIDLTKPWYHPDNLALANRMPWVYRCPADNRSVLPRPIRQRRTWRLSETEPSGAETRARLLPTFQMVRDRLCWYLNPRSIGYTGCQPPIPALRCWGLETARARHFLRVALTRASPLVSSATVIQQLSRFCILYSHPSHVDDRWPRRNGGECSRQISDIATRCTKRPQSGTPD